MAPAHFSSFELLLLRSRYQLDTAALLLLAWVFVNKRVTLDEDRRYLEMLAHGYRHTQDLDTLLAIAASRNLADIQLAAEVLLRERADEQSHPFLRQAIGLATSEGIPSLRNHHILRFLADLSGVAPPAFARLFREVTGQSLAMPADPSQHSYWQENAASETLRTAQADADGATAKERSVWRRWRAQRQCAYAQRQQARRQQEQLRQRQEETRRQVHERQEEALRQARERQEHARRQARERQEEERRQHQRRERQEQERHQRHQEQHEQRRQQQQDTAGAPPPHYRVRLALRVLELDEHASRRDIKQAYRRLAQRHHPDRFHGQGDLRVALASQRFQRIKNAYDYLMQHA